MSGTVVVHVDPAAVIALFVNAPVEPAGRRARVAPATPLASAASTEITTSVPASTSRSPVGAVIVGATVSSPIVSASTTDGLPAASRNCADTVLVPSPAGSDHGRVAA